MKTIYEAYTELDDRVSKVENTIEKNYKEEFFNLLSKFIYTNPKNPEQILNELVKLNSYEEKYNYLNNKMKIGKSSYIKKISDSYLDKIRKLWWLKPVS